jgi:hypothetical protein
VSPSFAHLPQNAFADRVNNSGQDEMPPPEVMTMGFSWGAFGLFWIWGIGNKVWISLLALGIAWIPWVGPLANVGFYVWLAMKGHELAWRHRRFESLEQYRTTMAVWNAWGIAAVILQIIVVILLIIAVVTDEQW